MNKAIGSDSFLAPQAQKQRKFDAPGGQRQQGVPSEAAAPTGGADALRRAQQRLSQEAGNTRGAGIDSPDQARRRLAGLREQIEAQPQAALMAHAAVDRTLYEAAMARPRG